MPLVGCDDSVTDCQDAKGHFALRVPVACLDSEEIHSLRDVATLTGHRAAEYERAVHRFGGASL